MIKKDELLQIAVSLADYHGYTNVNRDNIAQAADVSTGTVTNYLGTMKQLRRAIIRKAIRTENHVVISQALVAKDPLTKKLSTKHREAALRGMGLIE